jgi:hypothetical protein
MQSPRAGTFVSDGVRGRLRRAGGRHGHRPVSPSRRAAADDPAGSADVASGGWLAAANYAGYLVGALTASRVRLAPQRLTVAALVVIA